MFKNSFILLCSWNECCDHIFVKTMQRVYGYGSVEGNAEVNTLNIVKV